MLEERNGHSACSMGNKLFIIGGYKSYSFEILESVSRKFCHIKHKSIGMNKSLCLGKQIYVYPSNRRDVFVYNTDEKNWLIENLNLYNSTKNSWLGCVKLPNIQNDVNKSTENCSEPKAKKLKLKDKNPT